ncbi:hypothetical protein GC101_00985 [Paenibacillus sp. LMG 31459]|uniref:Peptidase M48 domain-containing protein n=1 Tax=Paenibacillus phytohabitans TaxID=2654978 RepID=A0ABX1Y930_9BACL|nr:hypothetical protein [Paenibacillus phytohabitans]
MNTPILVSKDQSKAVQEIKVGDYVYVAGLDLVWKQKKVGYSGGSQSSKNTRQPGIIFISYGQEQYLVVTPDSLFLMPDQTLKRADKLTIQDHLLNEKGQKVAIHGVDSGVYRGGFHHIATDTQEPNENLDGHLVIANGIVCADYTLQIKYHGDEHKKEFAEMPTVGSKAYNDKYGVVKDQAIRNKNIDIDFTPSSEIAIPKRPADALAFISEEDAQAHLEYGQFRDHLDPVSRSWIDYLFTQFKLHYPDINFSVDWNNDEVNAYAWISNGERHVQILGGLVRSTTLELEGLALVVAHEIGHHYGGEPTYPGSTLSCEGQADFYGARNVMRKVWFGEFYISVTEKAISQLADFFGVASTDMDKQAAFMGKNTNGCEHPPGDCRIETYNAAVDLKPKPACAG